MIAPEELTDSQTRTLRDRYGLDVGSQLRAVRLNRYAAMFCWVPPLLAAGLWWDGTSAGTALADKPAELVAWSLAVLMLVGNLAILFVFWRAMRRRAAAGYPVDYWSYALLRDRIGIPSPAFLRWIGRGSSAAICLVALATGRPLLAVAWILALAAGRLRTTWEDQAARLELARLTSIESAARGP